MGNKPTLTVYYDGACPRCVEDRDWYRRRAGVTGDDVVWFDITGREAELQAAGVDPELALRQLHVRDAAGRLHRELDAYILLLARLPRYRALARLMGLPVIRPLLSWLYRNWVLRRLKISGRI
ncbi:thiol-disulfide oxidoreductase DCC family protein [Marinobacter sp. SS21]|uniref:thiol-disulfide oxidoreductase DCC family protein n=1 Tax=Marinobacter sp. SS21 TaxID=2979460 RepID=UPI00232C3CB2|nr:DUF393 domain-containing protein [Marinobacter sp. SS21]MDC0662792.1 DUF393 domain-containing protein [Marinobacter sp. SS21]